MLKERPACQRLKPQALAGRQKDILGGVVREYIKTARPVASSELRQEFGIKASSATIRQEMLELDERGYLEQPHTSAGRIPTDRGYRFFVDYLLNRLGLDDEEEKNIKSIFSVKSEHEFVRGLANVVSRMTKSFSAVGAFDHDGFSKTSFGRVLEEPEFENSQNIRNFAELLDGFEEDLVSFLGDWGNSGEQVFIGGENPLEEAEEFSLIISSWEHPRGFRGFLTLMGPKRMDYQKNLSLLRFIRGV